MFIRLPLFFRYNHNHQRRPGGAPRRRSPRERGGMMSPPTPPVPDYRARRPPERRAEPADVYPPALLRAPPLLVAGCIYGFWPIFDYCTSAEPFPHVASLVAWMVLIGSITYGLSLRRRR